MNQSYIMVSNACNNNNIYLKSNVHRDMKYNEQVNLIGVKRSRI